MSALEVHTAHPLLRFALFILCFVLAYLCICVIVYLCVCALHRSDWSFFMLRHLSFVFTCLYLWVLAKQTFNLSVFLCLPVFSPLTICVIVHLYFLIFLFYFVFFLKCDLNSDTKAFNSVCFVEHFIWKRLLLLCVLKLFCGNALIHHLLVITALPKMHLIW